MARKGANREKQVDLANGPELYRLHARSVRHILLSYASARSPRFSAERAVWRKSGYRGCTQGSRRQSGRRILEPCITAARAARTGHADAHDLSGRVPALDDAQDRTVRACDRVRGSALGRRGRADVGRARNVDVAAHGQLVAVEVYGAGEGEFAAHSRRVPNRAASPDIAGELR